MPLDNNLVGTGLKSRSLEEDQDPSQPKMPRCRSGVSSSPKPSAPISMASLFTPRAFPPPSLTDVPVEYIIDQLHNLASHYWDKPDTADCTIVIPVPHPRGKAGSTFSADMPAFSMSSDPALGRRVTEPALNFVPRISLKLHMDYLSAHSTFLRGLFSGASSLDLISSASLSQAPSRPSPSGQFTVPENRLPRLMPCSPDHPILFLPVPDPSSIHLLVHWMYFGSTSYIEDSLNDGSVEWEGIARNVEYLGLPADIKVFLGRWYATWLHAERGGRYCSDDEEEEDSDDDASDTETEYYSDDEEQSDNDAADSPPPASVDLNAALAAVDSLSSLSDDDEPKRGRTRTTRPLSTSSAHSI